MSEWVSAWERLPDEDGEYLVCYEDIGLFAVREFKDGHFTHCNCNDRGLSHWREGKIVSPKKKRWMPKEDEEVWFIEIYGLNAEKWKGVHGDLVNRACLGVYRTEKEAEEMRDKIRAFVTEQIGEP